MSRSSWWYGILLFPVVIVMVVASEFAAYAVIVVAQSPDPPIGMYVAWTVLQILFVWAGVLVAVLVLCCLVMDLRSHRGDERWSPTPLWGLAGVAHIGGVEFSALLVVSVPALSYYLYQRQTHVGRP